MENFRPVKPETNSTPGIERREFLKNIAACAALVILPKSVTAMAQIFETETPVETENFLDITITGDKEFIETTKKALTVLQSSPAFLSAKKYLHAIQQTDIGSGMSISESIATFMVNVGTYSESVAWYASAIAHDTYHSLLYFTAQELLPDNQIPDDLAWTGRSAEIECMKFQLRVLQELNAPDYLIDHIQDLLSSGTEYETTEQSERKW